MPPDPWASAPREGPLLPALAVVPSRPRSQEGGGLLPWAGSRSGAEPVQQDGRRGLSPRRSPVWFFRSLSPGQEGEDPMKCPSYLRGPLQRLPHWACLGGRAGCVHPSWFAQPHLPGEAWFQDGLTGRTQTSFSSRPALCTLAAAAQGGGEVGGACTRGFEALVQVGVFWGLVAYRDAPRSGGLPDLRTGGKRAYAEETGWEALDGGRIPHFSMKEGERERKWVTRAWSLAEVGAEQGLAWERRLAGWFRHRSVPVPSPRCPQAALWPALLPGSPRVLASGMFRDT